MKMLKGEKQTLHPYVYGAFSNCNIIGSQERIFPIRVIRSKSFSLIYNPNYGSQTSNVTIDSALAMLDNSSEGGRDVASSWVKQSRTNPLVRKLHHRPEYELYNLEKDPDELKDEINNPEYHAVAAELKKQLHSRLAKLDDLDPIETEKSLIKVKSTKQK